LSFLMPDANQMPSPSHVREGQGTCYLTPLKRAARLPLSAATVESVR